ncbi:MAG TPA: phosphoenolpyruvate--protein phosphotransferase [Candidatus Hydrogenedentes bacterium]|nr:phosphoenolpyruvate--protein phosphotransferase [Candidatus Hydrogenedentota bacterium]
MEIALQGIGVSPGIAVGPALPYDVQTLDIPKYEIADTDAELERFDKAVEAVRLDLQQLYKQTAEQLSSRHAEIFTAHMLLLDDVVMREEINERIEKERLNVEYLVDNLTNRYSQTLKQVEDPRFRERTSDLLDVATRILGKLLNTELKTLDHLGSPCVVVAHDLSPSDTANIDVDNALGIVTDVGGPTSHTAILTRAFEIPAVVALRYAGAHITPGDMVVVDGARGLVIIRPTEKTLAEYTEEKGRQDERRRQLLRTERKAACATQDGVEVPLLANIELPVEVDHSIQTGARGVGLYRTEYLFLNRPSLPGEEEQFEAYRDVVKSFAPLPVTLRTLDLGGDKLATHLRFADEINPQLGWRAIRFCLERPDVFKAQLRAMLRASVHGHVAIMFPMVSGIEELCRVKAVLDEVRADLSRRDIPFDPDIKVGSMIEVPSAVITADLLASECDFFSIGTNDLIQYSLAVDRVNEKIAHMYEPAHPSVLRMIKQTADHAKAGDIPCGICGEMAGDPLFSELLLGLGVTSLSMSSVAIPLVRAQVQHMHMAHAKRFAKRVLKARTVTEVRDLLNKRQVESGIDNLYGTGPDVYQSSTGE